MASSVVRLVLGGSRRDLPRLRTLLVSDNRTVRPYSTRTSPWLMLPPACEGGDMLYKFYSLAENKVISISQRSSVFADGADAKMVGSSHGWLALFNPRNSNLFLTDPLSGCHIKLPPLDADSRDQLISISPDCRPMISNLILSGSPAEEDCRAMISYGPKQRLAFCCPRRSTAWTRIGDEYHRALNGDPWIYERFVYSNSQDLFYCITISHDIEMWDLRDPKSPKIQPLDMGFWEETKDSAWRIMSKERTVQFTWALDEFEKSIFPNCSKCRLSIKEAKGSIWRIDQPTVHPWGPWSEEETLDIEESCFKFKYLVFVESTGVLLVVTRYVVSGVGLDGSPIECDCANDDPVLFENCFPHKTVGFHVYKYDPYRSLLRYMDSSLHGLALFIGSNHGFALPAAEFSELEPNSIYYTDTDIEPLINPCARRAGLHGGHDLGIYNYKTRTFSPCYYPLDLPSIKRIMPAPMWFTPNTH